MKRRAIVILGIVISIGFLIYTLRDVSLDELIEHAAHANVWLMIAATAVATATFALRAIRWRILLRPVDATVGFRPSWIAICIGFMATNVIPARAGEFARAYSLTLLTRVRLAPSLASLIVERLFDGIVTVMLLIPAYYTLGPERLAEAGALVQVLSAFVIIVGIALVGVIATVAFPKLFLSVAGKCAGLLPTRFATKITDVLESFVDGLSVLRSPRLVVTVFVWSMIVWLCNAFSFYLGLLAFGIVEPGFSGAMALQSIISLFVALPSSPGFFGLFEAGARVCLELLYGIEPALIASFAGTYHIATFIPVTVLGIWYMKALGISRDDITKRSDSDGDA